MIFRLIGFILAVEGVVFKSVTRGYEPVRPHSHSIHQTHANGLTPLSRRKHNSQLHSIRAGSTDSEGSMVSALQSVLNSMFNNLTRKQQHFMDEIDIKLQRMNARLDEYVKRTNTINKTLNSTKNNLNRHLRISLDKTKTDTKFYQDYSKRLKHAEESVDRLDRLLKEHEAKLTHTRKDANAKMSGPNQVTVAQLNGLGRNVALSTQLERQDRADNSSTDALELIPLENDNKLGLILQHSDHADYHRPVVHNKTLLQDYIESTERMNEWHGDYHKKFIKVGKILQNISMSQRVHDHVNAHLEKVSWLMESLILSMHRRVLALEKANANKTSQPLD